MIAEESLKNIEIFFQNTNRCYSDILHELNKEKYSYENVDKFANQIMNNFFLMHKELDSMKLCVNDLTTNPIEKVTNQEILIPKDCIDKFSKGIEIDIEKIESTIQEQIKNKDFYKNIENKYANIIPSNI